MRIGRLFGRREFIRQSLLAGLGMGLLPVAASAAIAETGVRRYPTLGRTGLRISDISFGASRLGGGEERLVLQAFDRGINYFDTAEDYTDGESEITIGNALRGRRDKVLIASKAFAGSSDRKESMMKALEGSLGRLKTDHVDVYFNHAVNSLERLKNPEWYEFAARAREQGKIRFTGMSGHAGRLVECLDYAIDSGRFDVILAAYNFGQDPAFYQRFLRPFDLVALQPDLPRVLRKAKAARVGVIVMKTLMGARLNDVRPYEQNGATFAQAAFRWVLSNQNVDALIVSMTSPELIDEYLGASGSRSVAHRDLPLLDRYAQLNGATLCRHGCDACESACPYGVQIAEVMRTGMYARDYRDIRLARSEYKKLGTGARACLTCSARPCAGVCPHGIQTHALLGPTHLLLATN